MARVFPRRTKASPDDALAFFDVPPMLLPPEVDVVHVSCVFTWDLHKAEWLAKQWEPIAPVQIGGPATGDPGGAFTPGRYLKRGYVITSRGCPNHCWFCSVWRREPKLIELPIHEGNNVLDDNLLACSEPHVRAVFKMLEQQRNVEFTGGLEAARLKPWHVDALLRIRPRQVFFAMDGPEDEEPLRHASKMLLEAGFTRHHMRCYVLMGYAGDALGQAQERLQSVVDLGFCPMAMVYRGGGEVDRAWLRLQKEWARPASIYRRLRRRCDWIPAFAGMTDARGNDGTEGGASDED